MGAQGVVEGNRGRAGTRSEARIRITVRRRGTSEAGFIEAFEERLRVEGDSVSETPAHFGCRPFQKCNDHPVSRCGPAGLISAVDTESTVLSFCNRESEQAQGGQRHPRERPSDTDRLSEPRP